MFTLHVHWSRFLGGDDDQEGVGEVMRVYTATNITYHIVAAIVPTAVYIVK